MRNHERGDIMKMQRLLIPFLMVLLILIGAAPSRADISVQCPGDTNGDAIPESGDAKCMHISGGDGYITMADGSVKYIFSFADLTGLPTKTKKNKKDLMDAATLAAAFPAPLIVVDEEDEFYLTLTNVGMFIRPDLFDPHTVHWHGFPDASAIFDGVPDASISINMMSSLTYYYNVVEPGTYMWHCHVEATEHMQMGMLGNLYVRPAQNKLPNNTDLNGFTHHTGNEYAYNDGDGSTYYDVDYAIQIGSFDGAFHDASETVQPLPFALMRDNYPMLNGRGYPDTTDPNPLPAPAENGGKFSQLESSVITADPGDRVLLRLSNLNVTRFYTLATLGIPMQVVGFNARLFRGPSPDGGTTPGQDLYYTTNSVTLGGGEALDAIIEIPATAPTGTTYFLYTTNLNYLSNDDEEFGGMMTEIRVN